MSISRFFGLPGCGKTTTATMLCSYSQKKYPLVYCNVHVDMPDVIYCDFENFGNFEIMDGIYIVDEATINCGDRDFRTFVGNKLKYAMEHRHHRIDILLFSQEPDGVDKKLRSITDRCYYIKKGFFTGKLFCSVYRVPYRVLWPKGEHDSGENAGRILMGYVKPPLLSRIFAMRVSMKKWRKYFNSWECDILPPLPNAGDKYMEQYKQHWNDDVCYGDLSSVR